jgi:hypothetical protein
MPKVDRLCVCEYTFKYVRQQRTLQAIKASLAPDERRPPGKQVYFDGDKHLSMFEVDGGEHSVYVRR